MWLNRRLINSTSEFLFCKCLRAFFRTHIILAKPRKNGRKRRILIIIFLIQTIVCRILFFFSLKKKSLVSLLLLRHDCVLFSSSFQLSRTKKNDTNNLKERTFFNTCRNIRKKRENFNQTDVSKINNEMMRL